MNRRGISANPYLGSTTNGYAHPSGMALHYDDVPCINGSVSVPFLGWPRLGCVTIEAGEDSCNPGVLTSGPEPEGFLLCPQPE